MQRVSDIAPETSAADSLQQCLPGMIDQALGRLNEIGVQRLIKLAEAMVQERVKQPADAHLTGAANRN